MIGNKIKANLVKLKVSMQAQNRGPKNVTGTPMPLFPLLPKAKLLIDAMATARFIVISSSISFDTVQLRFH